MLEQREKQIKEVEAELAQADKSQQAITQEQNQQLDRDTQQERSTLQASLSDAKVLIYIHIFTLFYPHLLF
ncbi:hypothetical protein [Photobacterium leiognathi]|uniref:hypothetical protein n=1 Tax=Photobacterium leiognathi TaxID=553611 RepID=UPI0029828372|nr:hypothetical protein [Photobacterium leiognathi]